MGIKLEVGKFYKTKSGQKVKIIDSEVQAPCFTGAMFYPELAADGEPELECFLSWHPNGLFFLNDVNATHEYTIVEEWKEPAPKLKAFICTSDFVQMKVKVENDTWHILYQKGCVFWVEKETDLALPEKDAKAGLNTQALYWKRAPWLDEK